MKSYEPSKHFFPVSVEPHLTHESLPYVYREGENNIVINLESNRIANPYPTNIHWKQNGATQSNDSRRIFGYPTVTFTSLNRSDGGNYILMATNYRLDSNSTAVGTGIGSFFLNVLCENLKLLIIINQLDTFPLQMVQML